MVIPDQDVLKGLAWAGRVPNLTSEHIDFRDYVLFCLLASRNLSCGLGVFPAFLPPDYFSCLMGAPDTLGSTPGSVRSEVRKLVEMSWGHSKA